MRPRMNADYADHLNLGCEWVESAFIREHLRPNRFQRLAIALKNSGQVASDWPRYCGRKPKRIIRPLPMPTSTKAALPLMRSPPRTQPETRGSLYFCYQTTRFTA